MPYWPPDTPPAEPPQMPAAPNSGPAPVPYAGPGMAMAPDMRAPVPQVTPALAAAASVLIGVTGNAVQESPLAAPNVNPYDTGAVSPIFVGGDEDVGGRDIVAGSVAGAVAAAHAWAEEAQQDTYGKGSRIGDLMNFPGLTATGADLDPGTAPGKTVPAGGFYDPSREY